MVRVPAGCVPDLSGARRPYSPKFSSNVGATFSLPVGTAMVRVDAQLYYTSGFVTSTSADPLLRQKGYVKADLRIGYGPQDERGESSREATDRLTRCPSRCARSPSSSRSKA